MFGHRKNKKKDYNLTYDNLAIPEIHTQSDSDSNDADASNPVHTKSSEEEANISYECGHPGSSYQEERIKNSLQTAYIFYVADLSERRFLTNHCKVMSLAPLRDN